MTLGYGALGCPVVATKNDRIMNTKFPKRCLNCSHRMQEVGEDEFGNKGRGEICTERPFNKFLSRGKCEFYKLTNYE